MCEKPIALCWTTEIHKLFVKAASMSYASQWGVGSKGTFVYLDMHTSIMPFGVELSVCSAPPSPSLSPQYLSSS